MADVQAHWERVYATKRPEEVSWYRAHLDTSIRIITSAIEDRGAAIIDVGGGEATLVDDLLGRGYSNLSVLDLSANALQVSKDRLGTSGRQVQWMHGDVTTFPLTSHCYDLWHDRAVFHFLTDPKDRAAYVRQVAHAVRPGGHVVVATFGPEGPEKCSGLTVARYDATSLHGEFGSGFQLVDHVTELHETPWGAVQQFVYCYCVVH